MPREQGNNKILSPILFNNNRPQNYLQNMPAINDQTETGRVSTCVVFDIYSMYLKLNACTNLFNKKKKNVCLY